MSPADDIFPRAWHPPAADIWFVVEKSNEPRKETSGLQK